MVCRSDLSFTGPRIIPSLCVVHAGACGERSVGVLVRWGQRPVQQGRQGSPPHGQGARAVDVYVSAERDDPNVSRIRGRHRRKHRSRLIYRNTSPRIFVVHYYTPFGWTSFQFSRRAAVVVCHAYRVGFAGVMRCTVVMASRHAWIEDNPIACFIAGLS